MKRILLTWLPTVTLAFLSHGQGFVNLNFEDAKLPGSSVPLAASNAMPGWSAFDGTNQLSLIQYNPPNPSGPPIESPFIALCISNAYVFGGSFSVLLNGSSISISQTGLVPSGTQSLMFDTFTAGSPNLLVSLGGQNLSYTAISSGTDSYGGSYSTYAANVSDFAGQMETLTFSGFGALDDIQFLPEAIPEPSTAALFFLGCGILIYVRKRFQSKRQSFARASQR